MSRPSDRRRIQRVQRSSLVIAIIALSWAGLLFVTGGFDIDIGGARITAHEPLRPLVAAAIAWTVFILSGGETLTFDRPMARAVDAAHRGVLALWHRAPGPHAAAWILATATVLVSLFWGTKAVGGSDSWGYMSEAHLIAQGDLKVRQLFAKEVPWPNQTWSFTPLGYHPLGDYYEATGDDAYTIVPFYSAGLPLLMAFAKRIGGYQAMFFIVPILSGALVIGTYGIGRRLASSAAGLLGAWLVAISPCVMFMMMSTMTDVPVAGAFAVGFWLMLENGWMSAVGAGLFAAVGIMIRPNFAPLAAIMGLYYASKAFKAETRREGLLHGLLFSLAVLPGPITIALFNNYLYGSPMMSGYGRLANFFAFEHVVPNLQRYPAWLAEAQTHVAWIGLAAVFVPIRWIWSGQRSRLPVILGALSVMFVWGMYLVYDVYDAWWFSRFILASWPFIMLGTAAVAVAIARIRPKLLTPLVVAVMMAVSVYQLRFAIQRDTFNLWAGERRYVVAAKMARRLTPRNSVIISGQHTGSLRFYAGRMTMHYDPLETEWVDKAIEWLSQRGVHTYLMIEDWEVPEVKKRFEGQQAAALLDHPIAMYYDPGTLYLYDLQPESVASIKMEVVTGTYRDFWAVEPAPSLRFVLKP